jgi:putative ABC transport system permease protein
MALAMLVARAAVEDKITTVKSSIGNTVSVSPAGAQGFEGGGEPLKGEQLAKVSQLAHVSSVTQTLNDRLTTDNTNLVSAIEPGSLGNRRARNSGVGFMGPRFSQRTESGSRDSEQVTRTFTPPVLVTGTDNTASASVYGGDRVTFSSGQAFDARKDENVAVVGKALADKNSLKVGSSFTAYGQSVQVVGIYDTGNTFANAGLAMSLAALQRLSSQADSVTGATVTVDSVDNIDSVVNSIKNTLGSSADVVSSQEAAKQAIQPLESVKTISTFSLLVAVVAGAVIILLTMVMVVRERRREVGVFKAIGASNLKVMFQFMSEAVTLTVLGLVVGLIIGLVAANPVTKVLVNNAQSSGQTSQSAPGLPTPPEGRGQRFARRPGLSGLGSNAATNIRNVKASVGTDIIGYGIITAFMIAMVGSAIPALLISKIRPAEVMRAE